jgi:hypothetical protein
MEKLLSSGGVTTGSDLVFGPWLVNFFAVVGSLGLSFVSARNVVRCFEFRSRKDDVAAPSTTAGSYFSAGSSSHASSSSSSSSFSVSEDFFFVNTFSLRL